MSLTAILLLAVNLQHPKVPVTLDAFGYTTRNECETAAKERNQVIDKEHPHDAWDRLSYVCVDSSVYKLKDQLVSNQPDISSPDERTTLVMVHPTPALEKEFP